MKKRVLSLILVLTMVISLLTSFGTVSAQQIPLIKPYKAYQVFNPYYGSTPATNVIDNRDDTGWVAPLWWGCMYIDLGDTYDISAMSFKFLADVVSPNKALLEVSVVSGIPGTVQADGVTILNPDNAGDSGFALNQQGTMFINENAISTQRVSYNVTANNARYLRVVEGTKDANGNGINNGGLYEIKVYGQSKAATAKILVSSFKKATTWNSYRNPSTLFDEDAGSEFISTGGSTLMYVDLGGYYDVNELRISNRDGWLGDSQQPNIKAQKVTARAVNQMPPSNPTTGYSDGLADIGQWYSNQPVHWISTLAQTDYYVTDKIAIPLTQTRTRYLSILIEGDAANVVINSMEIYAAANPATLSTADNSSGQQWDITLVDGTSREMYYSWFDTENVEHLDPVLCKKYKIINRATGRALTSQSTGWNGKTVVTSYFTEGDLNQIWFVSDSLIAGQPGYISPSGAGMYPSGTSSGSTLATIGWPVESQRFSYDANSKVLKQNSTGLVLTDSAIVNEDTVTSASVSGSNNLQKWIIQYTGETVTVNSVTEQVVKIKNKGSNLFLTRKSNGTDLFVTEATSASDQKWVMVQSGTDLLISPSNDLTKTLSIGTTVSLGTAISPVSFTYPISNSLETTISAGTSYLQSGIVANLGSLVLAGAYIHNYTPSENFKASSLKAGVQFGKFTSYVLKNGSTILGDSDTAGTGTTVEITSPVSVSYTVVIYGDVTGDGNVSIGDLASIKQHILKLTTLSAVNQVAADVSRNSSVSISDLLAVKKAVLGIAPVQQS